MDKLVVKLKRHSSSYEKDQGEQPLKVLIDRCHHSKPTWHLPASRRAATGVWRNW